MKKSVTILILSAAAILILAGIEVVLVLRIHRLETGKFDYRYREIVQKGLSYIEDKPKYPGFKDCYDLLEKLSEKLIISNEMGDVDTLLFKQVAVKEFQKTLEQKQTIDGYLKEFLMKVNEESEFESGFRIRKLELFSDEKAIPVYKYGIDVLPEYPDTLGIRSNEKAVYFYNYMGNNFNIGFEYFVNFNNRKAVVLREMAGSLAIAFAALSVVLLMFIFTLRNLMEERRLSQLKTDFINNMTHELKTPLSTISVATRTLQNETVLDDRNRINETVAIIHRQNRQLTKQINHLLEISMWERKQFSLERKFLEIKPFLTGIAESFRWECKERSCKLVEEYNLQTERAYLDEVQMTVVLHNLLANAIKYNANEPQILLKATSDDRLKISVTDNGLGISREDQKHIFEKFYRVSTGNIHKVKGLGLGLFYVRQIVEAHGGSVDVVSHPGKGSIFTINIPINGKDQNTPGRG